MWVNSWSGPQDLAGGGWGKEPEPEPLRRNTWWRTDTESPKSYAPMTDYWDRELLGKRKGRVGLSGPLERGTCSSGSERAARSMWRHGEE